jgi:hypothetical protein
METSIPSLTAPASTHSSKNAVGRFHAPVRDRSSAGRAHAIEESIVADGDRREVSGEATTASPDVD